MPPYTPTIAIGSSTITTACSKLISTENTTSAATVQTPSKVTCVHVTLQRAEQFSNSDSSMVG